MAISEIFRGLLVVPHGVLFPYGLDIFVLLAALKQLVVVWGQGSS